MSKGRQGPQPRHASSCCRALALAVPALYPTGISAGTIPAVRLSPPSYMGEGARGARPTFLAMPPTPACSPHARPPPPRTKHHHAALARVPTFRGVPPSRPLRSPRVNGQVAKAGQYVTLPVSLKSQLSLSVCLTVSARREHVSAANLKYSVFIPGWLIHRVCR